MKTSATVRSLVPCICAALFCFPGTAGAFAKAPAQEAANPAPIVRVPPANTHSVPGQSNGTPGGPPRGAHLGQWMQQHGSLSPQQQQHALQGEPGFNQLPQQTQQRMMQRLDRLNNMAPQQRDRVLSRTEAMERMSPQQRGDVRGAMGQLGALPQDRRRMVAKSFRDLRAMPPQDRNAVLNSPAYRQQFSDEERGTLGNLLAVSPLLPPSR